jgi:hypothetical protein
VEENWIHVREEYLFEGVKEKDRGAKKKDKAGK